VSGPTQDLAALDIDLAAITREGRRVEIAAHGRWPIMREKISVGKIRNGAGGQRRRGGDSVTDEGGRSDLACA